MINQEVRVKHTLGSLLSGSIKNESECLSKSGDFVSARTLGVALNTNQSITEVKHFGVQTSPFSLEKIIAENPTLTGPEAIELYQKEIELDAIKYKSEIQDKLVELSQQENLHYKIKEYYDVYFCKVTKFTIENNKLFIYLDSIVKNSGDRIYKKDNLKYEYSYFCGMDVKDYDADSYQRLLSNLNYLEQNLIF